MIGVGVQTLQFKPRGVSRLYRKGQKEGFLFPLTHQEHLGKSFYLMSSGIWVLKIFICKMNTVLSFVVKIK